MNTADLLTKWLAEWIEQCVAIGRAMGIAYPHEYDVGMKILSRINNTFVLRLRLDTTTREVTLKFPTGGERSVTAYEAAMKRATDSVRFAATKITHDWLDEHPQAAPNAATPQLTLEEIDRRIQALPPPRYTRVR